MQKLSIKQLLCVSRLPQNVIAAQSYRRTQGEVSQLTSLLRKNAKRLPLVPVVNAVSATSLHKVCHTVICSVYLRPQEFIDDTSASLAELRSSVATVIETYSDPSVNHDGDETPKPRTLVTRRLESLNELRDSQATVAGHTSSADLCPSRKDSVVKIDPCIDIVAAVQSLTRVEEMRLWKYIDRIILQMPSIVVPLPKNLINGLAGSVASFRSSHQNGT
ncbi:hypothetical protein BC829DRAFT_72631 [Chytridium lagenaria]|nr:hypothetical protein BC829DRAFT_72631 [Chytridium lagenaria]